MERTSKIKKYLCSKRAYLRILKDWMAVLFLERSVFSKFS
ncbi:hypothetical protein LEP1GSC188_2694 [Leptospira weilii serovar Topaz str. LT2116]|uniref:Uncharacterized protein n=1 Tax=Leptospira weilii serovar Topaz str. LT2116 TaxID=1088540 RepID=M3G5K2_9LEPT|nr:hypothetical protein LEP1GSC188_2694 [Leptospira weilii serovar Topaz str. LT2116]